MGVTRPDKGELGENSMKLSQSNQVSSRRIQGLIFRCPERSRIFARGCLQGKISLVLSSLSTRKHFIMLPEAQETRIWAPEGAIYTKRSSVGLRLCRLPVECDRTSDTQSSARLLLLVWAPVFEPVKCAYRRPNLHCCVCLAV